MGLSTDNGHDSDQVFEFNGTQAVKIPDGIVTTDLKDPFVISVWMRHGTGGREKETILCNSDKTGKVHLHFLPGHVICTLAIYTHRSYSKIQKMTSFMKTNVYEV